jgi:hypothetical protein
VDFFLVVGGEGYDGGFTSEEDHALALAGPGVFNLLDTEALGIGKWHGFILVVEEGVASRK